MKEWFAIVANVTDSIGEAMKKLGMSGVCWLLAACSGTVNAGDRERWADRLDLAQGDSPQAVYEGSAHVTAYAVDETTVYALLDDENRRIQRLVSCPFEDCARNLKTLTELPWPSTGYDLEPTNLSLSDGELFWTQRHPSKQASDSIVSCSTSGCADGARQIWVLPSSANTAPDGNQGLSLAVDADSVYWWQDQALMRCSRSDCRAPQSIAEGLLGYAPSSALLAYGPDIYLSSIGEIVRIRKDGSAAVEVITRNDSHLGSISVGENGLFFPTTVLTGGIWHCAMDGCGLEPEPVVGGQRWPRATMVDATDVYWVGNDRSTGFDGESLLRCPQSGCERASVLAGGRVFSPWTPTKFVMNHDLVFWVEAPSPALTSLRVVRK